MFTILRQWVGGHLLKKTTEQKSTSIINGKTAKCCLGNSPYSSKSKDFKSIHVHTEARLGPIKNNLGIRYNEFQNPL